MGGWIPVVRRWKMSRMSCLRCRFSSMWIVTGQVRNTRRAKIMTIVAVLCKRSLSTVDAMLTPHFTGMSLLTVTVHGHWLITWHRTLQRVDRCYIPTASGWCVGTVAVC